MSGFPVTLVPSGGLPVTNSPNGAPVSVVASGGYPVTQVASGGVPLSGLTPPVPSGLVLQVQPTGADGSTTFVDQSSFARALTAVGNAQVDTAVQQFASPTALFDGTGDFVTAADSADFDFGSGAFTVEAWVRWTAFTSLMGIVSKAGDGGGTGDAWYFRLNSGQLQFGHRATNVAAFSEVNGVGSSFSLNTFYHVYAGRRNDGAIVIGDSGTRRVLGSVFGSIIIRGTTPLRIGCGYWTGSNNLNGYLAGVRVVKGACLYPDATYTVPTGRWPAP